MSLLLAPKPSPDAAARFLVDVDERRLQGQIDVRFELAWDPKEEGEFDFDLDLVVVFKNAVGQAIEVVYYGNLMSSCRSVKLSMDCLKGERELTDEQVSMCTSGLMDREEVAAASVYVVNHDAKNRGQSLEMTRRSRVRVTDSHGELLASGHITLNAPEFTGADAVRVCDLSRMNMFVPRIEPVGGMFADFMNEVGIELPAAA